MEPNMERGLFPCLEKSSTCTMEDHVNDLLSEASQRYEESCNKNTDEVEASQNLKSTRFDVVSTSDGLQ